MMNPRGATWAIVALALIAVGGIAWWVLYPRPTDEDRIRALVAQFERGVEQKAPDLIVGAISEDYGDDFGLRHKDVTVLIRRALRTEGQFEVEIRQVRVEISGGQATVTLEGEVTLVSRSEIVGPRMPTDGTAGAAGARGRYMGRVTLLLRKEGRDWRLVSSEDWQRRVLSGAWAAF